MIPVILSGGSGTRLWPVSRASYPKQFCDFFDNSFLNHTIRRLKPLGDVHILTTADMGTLTQRAVKREGLRAPNVILEPMGKNTAPAVALLCHVLDGRGQGDEIVGVFPSDHLVADERTFTAAVQLGESLARDGYVVTLGLQPNRPETGYGYIEVTSQVVGQAGGLRGMGVKGFREKPDAATARSYLQAGHYLWNAGMFVFRVRDMIAHFRSHRPQIWDKISQIQADFANAKYNYALVESISLDYAIMEKIERQACIPCDMGWSDVGSWDEMSRLVDEGVGIHTRSRAEVFNAGSENNYVFSVQNKVVGLIDVTDLIVVDTPDALLVVRKGASQKVKDLVDAMKEVGQREATAHPFETRPWGRFEILADEGSFKAKKITIDPGGQLSYQSHDHRSEHWVIVSGEGEVTIDEKAKAYRGGDFVYIPIRSKHRIRNTGVEPLVFVEVQTGDYFGEDDITRYKDDYDRV